VTSAKFAARTAWQRDESVLSNTFNSIRAKADHLDLTISNPSKVGLPKIDVSMSTASEYSPQAFGLKEARKSVSNYYKRRGIDVPFEQILLTSSTSEAYSHLFRLLLNAGESVLMPQPSYPLFDYLSQLADLKAEKYTIAYDGAWHLDTSTLPPSANAIVMVSPNNPTGSFADSEERKRINELQCPIISDEVFADYTEDYRSVSWINNSKNLTFSLSGLSKVAGLPQHKLSWIVVSGPPDDVQEALGRLELILDTYLSVASGIQLSAAEILDQVDHWQDKLKHRIRRNKEQARRLLEDRAITLRHSQGGWYGIFQMPETRSDEEWALLLAEEQHTLVQPGFLYDMAEKSCLVLSLIVDPEIFKTGIQRIISVQETYTS